MLRRGVTDGGADAVGYAASAEHLVAELGRLDVILALQVERLHARPAATEDNRGGDATPNPALLERLEQRGAEITERVAATAGTGVDLRLVALAELFDLVPFDVDVLMFCLAPEIAEGYERIFGHLHGDEARRAPTVGLILDALCPDLPSRLAARRRLTTTAPLLRHRLVVPADPSGRGAHVLASTALQLDPRVAGFLLEDDAVDDRLRTVCTVEIPTGSLADLVVPTELGARLAALAEHPGDRAVLHLWGGHGVGKRSAAAAMAAAWGAALLVVDGPRLADTSVDEFAELVVRIDREARLQDAVLYWSGVDELLPESRAAQLDLLLDAVAARTGPTFIGGATRWQPPRPMPGLDLVSLELPVPGHEERIRLWAMAVDDQTLTGGAVTAGLDASGPAGRFRLTGGQIRAAVATARGLATARSAGAPVIEQQDLDEAARLQSTPALAGLARRITPRRSWDDLVLPADRTEQLREIVHQVTYRAIVHETWAFGSPTGRGRGLTVLFAGPPGTGKTMAAEVLAHTVGLDLYTIDLSTVVSKFIGETEKNLGRIFDEAAASNAVLFFDEADALFGRRTQVRDAHDRYANLETSYLLQRLEDHDGVVVLATNLRKNMDDAFVRRLHATVEFPLPDEAHRLRIWQQVWPAAAPREDSLDLERLARDVDLPGGNIRNIAVAGAFLAAADGGTVTTEHLLAATRREFQKMGKVRTADDLAT